VYAIHVENLDLAQQEAFEKNLNDPFDHELDERERVLRDARRLHRQQQATGAGTSDLMRLMGARK
jgi:hypothetical protein